MATDINLECRGHKEEEITGENAPNPARRKDLDEKRPGTLKKSKGPPLRWSLPIDSRCHDGLTCGVFADKQCARKTEQTRAEKQQRSGLWNN